MRDETDKSDKNLNPINNLLYPINSFYCNNFIYKYILLLQFLLVLFLCNIYNFIENICI